MPRWTMPSPARTGNTAPCNHRIANQPPPFQQPAKRNSFARILEVDEMMIPRQTAGDPVAFGDGRSGQAKIQISATAEVQANLLGRVQPAAIKEFSAESLHAYIKANIAPGTTAGTDS